MSLVKYRIKEVATDFGVSPKEISQVVEKFFEKPKSPSQILNEEELNVVFDYLTQQNQISSLEVVFAVQPKAKAEPAKEQPKAQPQQQAQNHNHNNHNNNNNNNRPQQPKAQPQQPRQEKPVVKTAEPERKRERRVVDTSAVQVNSARFDDRVDDLISERDQNYQGGKQRFAKKGQQQNNKKDNKFSKGNKSKNEEQEKLRRLQMEVAR